MYLPVASLLHSPQHVHTRTGCCWSLLCSRLALRDYRLRRLLRRRHHLHLALDDLDQRLPLLGRVVAVVELKQRALRAQAGVVPQQVKGVELVVRGVARGLGAGAVAVRQPLAGPVHHELRAAAQSRPQPPHRAQLGQQLGERLLPQRAG